MMIWYVLRLFMRPGLRTSVGATTYQVGRREGALGKLGKVVGT
jgi:hypothetical protein